MSEDPANAMPGDRLPRPDEPLLSRKAGRPRDDAVRLAAWETGLGGLDWLAAFARDGRTFWVESTGGYPEVYAVRASEMLPFLRGWKRTREYDPMDVEAKDLNLDRGALDSLPEDTWLRVEAWDRS